MIDRIDIQNYKSIEHLALDLGRVTVLIGANGSGKSNILEAIALCSAAAANKLDNEFLFSRGVRISDYPRHMRSAFVSDNAIKPIDIKVMQIDKLSSIWCRLQHDNEPYGRWKNDAINQTAAWLAQDAIEEAETNRKKHGLDGPSKLDILDDTIVFALERAAEGMRRHSEEMTLSDFLLFAPENSSLRDFESPGQIQPLGIRGEGLFKLLTLLTRDENRDRLNEIQERLQLLDWFGDFQIGGNVALGERTLRIRDQYLDGDLAYFTQRSANEGFLFLLFYFTLFVAKETPRFFAIDNIDTSLNPKLCAELLRQLTELAEKYDKQVILTTHNPAVLDGLNLRDENQKLYVVERDLDGRTQARRIPPPHPPEKHEEAVPLSEAFLRGYIGGLPKNF